MYKTKQPRNIKEVRKEYKYDAFGVEEDIDEEDTNPWRYCGEYYDKETGRIYLRARYYTPATGRFMSEDPIRDGLNWYTYTSGNPIRYKDPTGYWEEGDELLPSWAQSSIRYYTDQWLLAEATGDRVGMDFAHQQAVWVRGEANAGRTPGRILNVPRYNQLNHSINGDNDGNNMCWATSSAMILSFYLGDNVDRTITIAQAVKGSTEIEVYNQGAFVTELPGIVGFNTNIILSQITFEGIETEINNGNPIYFDVAWNVEGGHALVIVGTVNINGVEGVIYNDPWEGVQKFLPYDEFSGEGTFQNEGTWFRTTTTSRQ